MTALKPIQKESNLNYLHDMVLQAIETEQFDKAMSLTQQGKQAAQQAQQRVQKTIKTRPASYAPASNTNDDEGMPSMLKMILGRNG